VSCEDAILVEAARIKAGSEISVSDAWIAATAAVRGATLVHKDPAFVRLDQLQQERLHR
jgi:predicted nucleic acid-binding protein